MSWLVIPPTSKSCSFNTRIDQQSTLYYLIRVLLTVCGEVLLNCEIWKIRLPWNEENSETNEEMRRFSFRSKSCESD